MANCRNKPARRCSSCSSVRMTRGRGNCAHANVDSLVGSPQSTRSGKVAAEVSCRVGRYRRAKWRSPANIVGHFDGNGAVALLLDLTKAFERVSFSCGLGVGDALQLSKEDLAGAVRLFRAPEACAVRRMCGGAAHDHHDYFARVKVELLASTHCVAGCAE